MEGYNQIRIGGTLKDRMPQRIFQRLGRRRSEQAAGPCATINVENTVNAPYHHFGMSVVARLRSANL